MSQGVVRVDVPAEAAQRGLRKARRSRRTSGIGRIARCLPSLVNRQQIPARRTVGTQAASGHQAILSASGA